MNKITDKEIMDYLKEQHSYLKSIYDERQLLGLFTYGKCNYGFAEKIEDVETVLCYIPTFDELCCKTEPIAIKYIEYTNDKKIRICDVRLLHMLATNQEKIIMEAVFSDYCIINPRYRKVFDKYIFMNREAIFHCNQELRIQKSVENGYTALNNYEKTKDIEDLFEASRLRIWARLYIQGVSCENCINIKKDYHINYLWQIKNGEITPDTQEIKDDYESMLEEAAAFTSNENCKDLIKNSVVELMKVALTDMMQMSNFNFRKLLTKTEKQALEIILNSLDNRHEGTVSISFLTDNSTISRPVFKNVLQKMKENNVAEIDNQGVKGTYIKIIDGNLLAK